jgi:hypothetical protein
LDDIFGSAVVHEIKEPAGMSRSPESANSPGANRRENTKSEQRFINSLQLHKNRIEARESRDTGLRKAGIEQMSLSYRCEHSTGGNVAKSCANILGSVVTFEREFRRRSIAGMHFPGALYQLSTWFADPRGMKLLPCNATANLPCPRSGR